MSNDSTAVDFGINLFEQEIDDVIFRTNEFLTDATFTGGQGPFWWILQMSMGLAGLFAIIMCAHMAYKMMVKREPIDVMKLFKPKRALATGDMLIKFNPIVYCFIVA